MPWPVMTSQSTATASPIKSGNASRLRAARWKPPMKKTAQEASGTGAK